jgi:leader peptidase (prepilin peptidase)/N-methyltransferase
MPVEIEVLIYVFVFAVGAVIGSFLNVLIYRIPLKLDWIRGSSFCPKCEHKLGPLDLVPVLSYLFMGRKCRYCHAPISPRYMIIELIGALMAVGSWAAFIHDPALLVANDAFIGIYARTFAALLYFIVLCILLVITFIDADTMEIPDGLNIALLICGILAIFVAPEVTIVSRIIGLFCISVPLLVITLVIPNAFGGGDVKLMVAAGFLLGWQGALVALFVGVVLGGAYGAFLMASKKKGAKEHFAFGPALCLGITSALFFAGPILDWYLGFF